MINKKYHTIITVTKSNRTIEETVAKWISPTHILKRKMLGVHTIHQCILHTVNYGKQLSCNINETSLLSQNSGKF
jgi:hypothetical protein